MNITTTLRGWLRSWLQIEADRASFDAIQTQFLVALEDQRKIAQDERKEAFRSIESLKLQIDDLRRIVTERHPVPQPRQVRTWSEARRVMGDPIKEIMNAD